MKIGAPPSVVSWIYRGAGHSDCGVVVIAQATGFSYEETLSAALSVSPSVLADGLSITEVKRILKELGFKPTARKKFDINTDTGVLYVRQGTGAHWVYLWGGRVVDPQGAEQTWLWRDPEAFLRSEGRQWHAETLVTFEEEK